MARILIAGCGDVGAELGIRLTDDGHLVWGLRRCCNTLPSVIHPFVADLTKPETLQNLPPSLDVVFYTAAPNSSSEDVYRATYVDGVRCLLAALATQGHRLQRFFFTSSTGVYAQTSGEWVDETSPTAPLHFSGLCLLEGEHAVSEGPFPATVLRLGGIYGPGRTRLIDSIRQGTASCMDGPPLYTNRIHRDDCAGALRHLMRLPRPDRLYVGVDHEPADQCAVLCWLALQLGLSPPKQEAMTVSAARSRRSNKRCNNHKLAATGYEFRYPTFREGYRSLLATMARE